MANEKVDYVSILADMKAKRSALDASIASLEAALASGVLGQIAEGASAPIAIGSVTNGPVDLPVGAFLGKSVPEAIKLYLAAVKRKQTNSEIATAIKEYGVESLSPNFDGVVTNALSRLRSNGEVLRFKEGWGLAEHYNESLRSRLTQPPKRARSHKKAARKKGNKREEVLSVISVADSSLVASPVVNGPEKPETAVRKYIASKEGEQITTTQVAEALHMRVQTVALILSKIAHAGTINKNPDGTFSIGKLELPAMVN